MPKNRILETLEAGRALRRRRKLQKQKQQEKKVPSPPRTQSLPIIRIVSTRANDEDRLDIMGETESEEANLHPRVQMESQEEDELLRLRMQLHAESASRKHYSTSSLQHNHTIEYTNSRVSAQQSLIGLPTVPDTATRFENERVFRRFTTAPQRLKSSMMQPVKLHMDEEDEEAFVNNKPNGTSQAPSSQSLFCGIPVSCDPSPPSNDSRTPGIEMQDSFRTLFEPINNKARQLFGGSVRPADNDGASAVTEPFDNRSLQRNGTWATAFSVQDYLGAWNLGKDKPSGTPTSVANVAALPVSPIASRDEEWDTSQIADRMEQSLATSEQERYEDGVSSEDACYGETPPARVHSESLPSQHQPPCATSSNDSSTKCAAPEQPVALKTKNFRSTSPIPGDSFWEDLLAEGIIEREDFSACSSGFGIEIVNAED
uniref:Uncharacterized protein n=1 Tax=Amphora coffeiformis TaxID=265554 RepID=A0A7S3P425_9STRA|mmetsp:Transcript_4685/g.8944  ORF Transcript_4685/g.8944 Transcript_4685/m.8944 type:complete len:430 (+) Transcript_4685:76-1365(+)